MSDKKTISIEFKEDAVSSPSQETSTTPAIPPVDDDAARRIREDNEENLNRLQAIEDYIGSGLNIRTGKVDPEARQVPDDAFWTWEDRQGANPDPFGIFDTSQLDPKSLQDSIDLLNKEFESLTEASQAAARSGLASANAANGLAGGANAAAAALGGGSGGSGGGGVPVGPGGISGIPGGGGLAGSATAAAGALTGIIAASLAFNEVVDELVEMVGNFSGEVAAASAESRVREIQDRIRLAQEIGPDVANLERLRSDVATELRGIVREVAELSIPFIELGGVITRELVTPIRAQLEIINDLTEMISEITGTSQTSLSVLAPGIAAIMDAIKLWRGDRLKGGNDTLQKQIDDLFNPINIGVRDLDPKSKMRAKGDPIG